MSRELARTQYLDEHRCSGTGKQTHQIGTQGHKRHEEQQTCFSRTAVVRRSISFFCCISLFRCIRSLWLMPLGFTSDSSMRGASPVPQRVPKRRGEHTAQIQLKTHHRDLYMNDDFLTLCDSALALLLDDLLAHFPEILHLLLQALD